MSSRSPTLALLVAAALWLLSGPLWAITFPDKPPNEHFYVDGAGLIDSATGEQIDQTAAALLQEERIPLFVVTIQSLSAMDAVTHTIEGYAQALFDEWGIGSPERNYGMLLLISRGDRKARIELGAGWNGAHDYDAQRVMGELIVPAFKRGDYGAGIRDGVRGLDAMARGLALPKAESPGGFWPLLIGGLVLMVAMIVNLFKRGQKGWAWALIALLGVILFFLIRAAMAGGGSGGGFGGGSSGGGGATGSW